MTTIAHTPEDLTPAWFTDMLRGAKRVTDSTVDTVEIDVVGTGQLGSLLRAALSYDRPEPDAPHSVIVKLASTDDGSRAMGVRTGAYEAEVRFYQQIAPTIRMDLPDCYYAAFDAQHGWTTLVLTALIERVAPLAPKWIRGWGTPRVVQHGDYRLDNMLLATRSDVPRITVVDWQTVKLGPPTIDASYYLGVCLPIEERRRHECDLIAEYHGRLIVAGVRDWSWDDCWLEYRTQSIYGLYMALVFGAQVKQTERGDAMFAMATRVYADLALDHDAAGLLEQQL